MRAIGIAGKPVGPCGVVVPLVLSKDGTFVKPLDAEGPTMRCGELDDAVATGAVTRFVGRVIVSSGDRVAWTSHEFLCAAWTVNATWRELRTVAASQTLFVGDDSREVVAASGKRVEHAFGRMELSVVDACRRGFDRGDSADRLLRDHEFALRATLYTSRARPQVRWETLLILGHLYRANDRRHQLETLHRLKVARQYGRSFDEFLCDVATVSGYSVARV